ncbi:hypothetical protein JCM10207_007153 [Rhodosporidiobolus poonsookiae]
MSLTNDSDKLFQTDEQHRKTAIRAAKAEALAERGAPIKLGSKPLQVVVRENGKGEPDAWVAESGFVVRRVGLESGKTKQLFKGHTGPVTSIVFYTTPSGRELLISGSWDKSIRVWDIETKTHLSTTLAHIDFVKTLHVIPELALLVSGSSDKDLRLWDLFSLDALAASSLSSSAPLPSTADSPVPREGAAPPPATALHPLPCAVALKAHTRPIECLASYALLEPLGPGQAEDDVDVRDRKRTGRWALVSADSMGAVKVWEVWREGGAGGAVKSELRGESRQHEAGIWDVQLGPEGELWTVSADNSLLLSSLSLSDPCAAPTPLLRIPHPAQVRSFLPLPLSPLLSVLPAAPPYLLTGASDELLRVLDLSCAALDPNPKREAARGWNGLPLTEGSRVEGQVNAVEAHTHEVVQLCAYVLPSGEGGRKEAWVLSASLDATLRRWRVEELRSKEWDRVVVVPVEEEEDGTKESLLTAEEEAELEALMADD